MLWVFNSHLIYCDGQRFVDFGQHFIRTFAAIGTKSTYPAHVFGSTLLALATDGRVATNAYLENHTR
jgi:hypothetical protein